MSKRKAPRLVADRGLSTKSALELSKVLVVKAVQKARAFVAAAVVSSPRKSRAPSHVVSGTTPNTLPPQLGIPVVEKGCSGSFPANLDAYGTPRDARPPQKFENGLL